MNRNLGLNILAVMRAAVTSRAMKGGETHGIESSERRSSGWRDPRSSSFDSRAKAVRAGLVAAQVTKAPFATEHRLDRRLDGRDLGCARRRSAGRRSRRFVR